jgi:pyruvate/2-oxoglutarate dehydrogenase complex dihydrolipoamide dehydrogenase (E3) component
MSTGVVMEGAYDLVAIGAGTAGAVELAAFHEFRSVVIEKNRPGGMVTTTGGAPTKTLREAALYLTGFRDGDIYGLELLTVPGIVLPTIRMRTRDVSEFLPRVTAENIARQNVAYVLGHPRLGPGRTILVRTPDGPELALRAKAILIATGSRPRRPKRVAFEDPAVCDSDGHGGPLKLIFRKDNQALVGVHCIGGIASELVGTGQMVIRFAGTLRAFDEVSINTPTYRYAYKYAAFDGFRRLNRQ